LVIEYVFQSSARPILFELSTTAGGVTAQYGFPSIQDLLSGSNIYFVGQQVRIYADAGSTVTLTAIHQVDPVAGTASLGISGHLVPTQ
jgi:hypothetical protein